jgi:hypothetical protein
MKSRLNFNISKVNVSSYSKEASLKKLIYQPNNIGVGSL